MIVGTSMRSVLFPTDIIGENMFYTVTYLINVPDDMHEEDVIDRLQINNCVLLSLKRSQCLV